MESTTRELAIHYAKLSSYSYLTWGEAVPLSKKMGYNNVELIDNQNAQCMIFENDTDIVVAFRGTEPDQLKDVIADLKSWKHRSKGKGRVHDGFYDEVKKVWDDVVAYIDANPAVIV